MNNVKTITDINKSICTFINGRFFSPFKINGKESSLNNYAKACNLSSSTISKIKGGQGYNIPISTIYAICSLESVSLNQFFTDFEQFTNKV